MSDAISNQHLSGYEGWSVFTDSSVSEIGQ